MEKMIVQLLAISICLFLGGLVCSVWGCAAIRTKKFNFKGSSPFAKVQSYKGKAAVKQGIYLLILGILLIISSVALYFLTNYISRI